MKKEYKKLFTEKVSARVRSFKKNIILRADLNFLGDSRQISRAIKTLLENGSLIKLGYGIYVKAKKSPYIDEPIPVIPLSQAFTEALGCLKVNWQLGEAIQNYNAGRTQQVPVQFVVRLKSRFRRQLAEGKRKIIFEGNINAR